RRDALQRVGYFDARFFLYYEEVDLCRRFRNAGYRVHYWPDIEVVHLGGESSKTIRQLEMSSAGAQLTLWRMRSALLYYRKHHGWQAWLTKQAESGWHTLRARKNIGTGKAEESLGIVHLMERAWQDTHGGHESPARPW